MRVIFFGTSSFAIPPLRSLLDSLHDVPCAVTRPPRPAGRGKRLTQPPVHRHLAGTEVQVHQPSRLTREFIQTLTDMEADLMVTASYGAWLPEELLKASRLGVVNIHPSLLPQYRGAAPVARSILDGREKTGVSFMLTDSGWDTGPLIAVYSEIILPDDTAGSLEERLAGLAGDKVVHVIEGFDRGILKPVPQAGEPIYAEKVSTDETWLNWTLEAEELERKVRAFQPSPGARTSLRGRMLKVTAARVSGIPASPGEVVVDGGTLRAGCGGKNSLEILRLQPASGSEMTAGQFLRGARIETGERFERV